MKKTVEVWIQESKPFDSYMREAKTRLEMKSIFHGNEMTCEIKCEQNKLLKHIEAFDPMTPNEYYELSAQWNKENK